ncbi:MAG TPA: transposase, partial [Candidatus Avisuccinivibrio pullicola]|nr:transposase [Candidatus Avisuccinivibrio pullicola]
MTKSAKGTVQNPGVNVRAKSGLNRELLLRASGEAGRMLEYKLRLRGGLLIKVPPQYTSQKCSVCGHVSENNRK